MEQATLEKLKEKARELPLKPGVYIMLDRTGDVIYVGKAKALKNRVSQYFQDSQSHTVKTRRMVSQIDDFHIIVASSEFEALVLECSLIKLHMPKYNILLKDSKGYPFVRLSREEYPRFSLAGRKEQDGAEYYGPFGSRTVTRQALDAVLLALKMPTCSRKFPRDIGRERPCLNFSMGRCDGYCRGTPDQAAYNENIRRAVLILEGKTEDLTAELEREMAAAAADLRFEQAADLRDRLRAVEMLGKRQKVLSINRADMDVVGFFRGEARTGFAVLHYVDGSLVDKDFTVLSETVESGEREILTALTQQYYFERSTVPPKILLPMELEDGDALAQLLTESVGRTVALHVPRRGENVKLVQLACLNAKEEVERVTSAQEKRLKLLETLGRTLGLEKTPRRIEAYDISNTGKSEIVGAMTVFEDGRPRKRDYRRFLIKEQDEPDDYAAMGEMLRRRLRRYADGDEHFSPLPDLMLIDGGSTHTAVALREIEALGYDIPAFGMVKDDRHRTRALTAADGREFGIQGNQALFALVGSIQEETHNTAIGYHRKRREELTRKSELDNIPGVGETRKKQLLRRFGSVKKIREASREDLAAVLPKNAAGSVYDYFHPQEEQP